MQYAVISCYDELSSVVCGPHDEIWVKSKGDLGLRNGERVSCKKLAA